MLPQLIMLSLLVIDLGISISRHGETKKETKYNAWATLIAKIIIWAILYFGGFWNVFLK